MALTLTNTVDIIEVMENYIQRIRPPEDIRDKLDISYKIDNQSIILFEIRPDFFDLGQKLESHYAKATYVKNEDQWKVYWMRGNLKWTLYEPTPSRSRRMKKMLFIDSG
jgi:hypothetical protein